MALRPNVTCHSVFSGPREHSQKSPVKKSFHQKIAFPLKFVWRSGIILYSGFQPSEGLWSIFIRVMSRCFLYTAILHLLYLSFRCGSMGYSELLQMGHGTKKVENHWSNKIHILLFTADFARHVKISFSGQHMLSCHIRIILSVKYIGDVEKQCHLPKF